MSSHTCKGKHEQNEKGKNKYKTNKVKLLENKISEMEKKGD